MHTHKNSPPPVHVNIEGVYKVCKQAYDTRLMLCLEVETLWLLVCNLLVDSDTDHFVSPNAEH